uniref:Uncharacterized protein n=1 Tax=Anguilla anguilla TaxID=7936 RepID=A0A0E9V765_ANGAN
MRFLIFKIGPLCTTNLFWGLLGSPHALTPLKFGPLTSP